jgi:hypothetical protein
MEDDRIYDSLYNAKWNIQEFILFKMEDDRIYENLYNTLVEYMNGK